MLWFSSITGIIRCAKSYAESKGVSFTQVNISDLPLFNEELLASPPPQVLEFIEAIKSADAVFFACPEYNYNLTAALKNALDWASIPQNAWSGKACAVAGSGGGAGTARAQLALRQSGVFLNLHFVQSPEVCTPRLSGKFFAENGDLVDEKWIERVQNLVDRLIDLDGKLR